MLQLKPSLKKERAAEAVKQKRLEEEEALKNGGKKKVDDGGKKSQYKTLSAEELARIEEKKRRKKLEAMGLNPDEIFAKEKAEREAEEAAILQPKTDEKGAKEKSEEKPGGGLGGLGGLGGGLGGPSLSLNLGGIAGDDDDDAPTLGGGLGSSGGLGSGLGGSLGGLGDKEEKSKNKPSLGIDTDVKKSEDKAGKSKKNMFVSGGIKSDMKAEKETFSEDTEAVIADDDTEWIAGKNVKVKEVKTQRVMMQTEICSVFFRTEM